MIYAPVVPRHVAACQHSPVTGERWFVYTWKVVDSGRPDCVATRIPYSCNSWRCPVCARHEAAVTFARMKEAIDPLDPMGWCMLVLTIDRDGYYGGEPWRDVNEAYRALSKMTRATLGRIGRLYGPDSALERSGRAKELRTVRKLGNRWVAVVEAHRSGWPHVNLLVWCPELAAELRAEHADRLEDPELADAVELARDAWKRKEPVPAALRARAREATLAGGTLLDLLTASGWGRQSTAEAARDSSAIASYMVKLAGHHDASVGELAKITQAPLNAPVRFRRLRSGRGFLPPRAHNPDVTGVLIRRRRDQRYGTMRPEWDICPVNAPKDLAQVEQVERSIRAELALIDEEEKLMSRARGKLPPLPPVRIAIGERIEGHLDTSERNWATRVRSQSLCG